MAIFIPVDLEQVKECQLCGQPILFVERREGRMWFPTDAIQEEVSRAWGYMMRGPEREVALLHRCFGDPKDETTVNGRRAKYNALVKDIRDKMESVQKGWILTTSSASPEGFQNLDEYKKLVDEYAQVVEQFSDIL